jgi:hypothetical protein
MTRTGMPQRERELVHLVGGTLQLLDDYLDRHFDQQAGVTTPATRGQIKWRDLWQKLDRVQGELVAYYDPPRAIRFIEEMRMLLCVAGLACFKGARRRRLVAPADEPGSSPSRLLLRRGCHVPVNQFATSAALADSEEVVPSASRVAAL